MYRGDPKVHPLSKQAADEIVTRVTGLPESGGDIDRYLDGSHFEMLPGARDPSIARLWRIGKWILVAIIMAGPTSAFVFDVNSFRQSTLCMAWIATFILATIVLGILILLRKRRSRRTYFEELLGLVQSSSEATLKFFFNGIWQDGVEVGPGALLTEEKHWNNPRHPLNWLFTHKQYGDPVSESPYNHDDSGEYPTNYQVQAALRDAKAAVTKALEEQRVCAEALIVAVGWLERANELDLETRKGIAEHAEERLGLVTDSLRRFSLDLQNATLDCELEDETVPNHGVIYDVLIAFVKERAETRVEVAAPLQTSAPLHENPTELFEASIDSGENPLADINNKNSS